MIDLHTHTLFSDGALIPSELVYRAKVKGYDVIAITDHGDFSNFDFIIPRIKRISDELSRQYDITIIPGIEITYVPPKLISKAVKYCRKLGAALIVGHGETPAETVPHGTNLESILAEVDILAHPGYITQKEAELAKKNSVYLDITTRAGHSKANEHVAEIAKKCGAKLVLNSDTHEPEDLLTHEKIKKVLDMSKLSEKDYKVMKQNSFEIIKNIKI
jgi:putative hydrolase